MNWSLAFEPLLSPLWLAAVLVPVAALVVAGLFFRRPGGLIRLAAFAALAIALLNPVLLDEEREPLKSVVALVVDRSQSQDIGERTAQTDSAVEELQTRLARFPQFEVRVVESGRAEAADDRTQTRLFGAAEQALRDVPPSRIGGTVMVTDGQVHDAPAEAGSLSGPLHVLVTGEEGEFDRRIRFERAPRFGIVGRPVDLTYRVLDTSGDGGTVTVRVLVNGEPVGTHEAVIGEEMPLELTIPNAGKNIVELSIETAPGELTDTNNRTIALLDGIRENLRVLLVSGEPHAGERTWRNLLKSDTAVELVHFTILRPPEKQDGTPINELSLIAFPIRELFEVKIDEFDLIIFDRYKRRGVLPRLYLANIADYVRKGGALLMAVGPDFASPVSLFQTPIGDILPAEPSGDVHEEGYRPALTAMGRRHPVTADLAGAGPEGGVPDWGRWFRLVDTRPRSGTVVMQDERARPLVVLDRVGEGRVAQINSDHMWLWTRGFEGGGPQAELLRRVAHWLMKEPDLEENDLRATVRGDRMEIERRSLEPAAETVEVTGPSGETISVPLAESGEGRATGTLTVDEPGLYRLSDGERTRLVTVGAVNPVEYADVRATDAVLTPVAEASGGSVHWLADGMPDLRRVDADRRAAGRNWIGLRANNDYVVTGVLEVPLLPALLTLLLALGALIGGWLREAR